MCKIYVTSDPHFSHSNIIKYCNRPFSTVEEMDETLIKNWNDVVRPEDTVICLGDFALTSKEEIIRIGKSLNGNKILILGNHDHGTKATYEEAGFTSIFGEKVIMNFEEFGKIHFSHHRVPDEETHYINLYGHQHDKPMDDEHHKCVSVELTNYKPILLSEAIKGLTQPEENN